MELTFLNRIKICFEVLTIRSGHKHTAQEKILSTFVRGYEAGRVDFGTNDKYSELILEVQSMHKGESRHETALRYIKACEIVSDFNAKMAKK